MYGLEMVQRSQKSISPGTIYVTLGRLKKKNLIQPTKVIKPKSGGPKRTLFEATPEGKDALRLWGERLDHDLSLIGIATKLTDKVKGLIKAERG